MKARARMLTLALALVAAVLILVPLPVVDLLVMIPMQYLIVMGVRWCTGQTLNPMGAGKLVLGYALVGTFLSFLVCNLVLFVGHFLAAPFALFWCYTLGELTLFRAKR